MLRGGLMIDVGVMIVAMIDDMMIVVEDILIDTMIVIVVTGEPQRMEI